MSVFSKKHDHVLIMLSDPDISVRRFFERLLNSGFNVILRDEKLGVQGTLEVVSKKFGLS